MANWISSKLKVAETFFEQIDQQAAESLKKNERSLGSAEDQKFNVPTTKTALGGGKTVSLKDQLKKKSALDITNNNNNNNVECIGKFSTDPTLSNVNHHTIINNSNGGDRGIASVTKSSPKSKSTTLTDTDWTQLLSTPTTQLSPANRTSNGSSSTIRGFKKDARKQGSAGSRSNLLLNNLKNSGVGVNNKSKIRSGNNNNSKLNGKPSDVDDYSSSSARSSSFELQTDCKELNHKEVGGVNLMEERNDKEIEESKDVSEDDVLQRMGNKSSPLDMSSSVSKKLDGVFDVKKGVGNVNDRLRSTVKEKHQSGAAASKSSISDDLKKGSSTSDGELDSDSDSVSTSDSESEREREMRERILAEKAVAKAVEAIKERENMVARLEGEKQSLEKILEERAKQQAQEASELQTTMMETMEAVELEKQKHNNTRMEALPRLAKLEIANADLARSLAAALKNLEMENNRVAELRQQFELEEVAHEELRRKIYKTHQTGTFLNQAASSKGVEFEQDILEAEYGFLTDKIASLENKAKKLEENIETTRKDIEEPTEVEIELKRRLAQLTDHLIQKQAQVEALSSEKATLLFRIEGVSRLLDENGSNSRDLESGTWETPDSKLRPLFEDKIRSGRKRLGSLLQQLDAIFVAGAVFVRRNPTAKLCSLVYLVCLHFWVIYIFSSHSQVSDEGRSGAVVSLENINQTAGV